MSSELNTSVLTTKIFMPASRREIVTRKRLYNKLARGRDKKLVLISAPAGFGKSTLVSGWAETAKENVAWYSLDESDNDPSRFLVHLIAAVRTVFPAAEKLGKGTQTLLKSAQFPSVIDVMTTVINDLSSLPGHLFFVFDDYHVIETPLIFEYFQFLLEHLPPRVHLVISTRDDPNLPLAQLRARQQLIELRAADLRFTPEEAAEFLQDKMGLTLSAEEVAALESRTEGWIVGLQLAAISLQDHENTAEAIQSFTGSHRFVLDYLIEEVLNRQTPETQKFLLYTSILDRLCARLCDSITGRNDSQEVLESLESANLFIIPLDQNREWYRYHHLFRELLIQRMRQAYPQEMDALYREASEYCEKYGVGESAIEYALKGNDINRAVDLIEMRVEQAWQSGQDTKLRLWLDSVPLENVKQKPKLSIFYAWSLFTQGKSKEADEFLHDAEARFGESGQTGKTALSPEDKDYFLGTVHTMHAFMDFYRTDANSAVENAHKALEILPENSGTWRNTAMVAMADAYVIMGDYSTAIQYREKALKVVRPENDIYHFLVASIKYVISLTSHGDLQKAFGVCENRYNIACELGIEKTEVIGWLLCAWGNLYTEINDLEKAYDLVTRGIGLVEDSDDLPMTAWCYISLAHTLFALGKLNDAQEVITSNNAFFQNTYVPVWFDHINMDWQVRIWLAQGDLNQARRWLAKSNLDINQPFSSIESMPYFTYARVMVADGKGERVAPLLNKFIAGAQWGGLLRREIRAAILLSLTFHSSEEKAKAAEVITDTLEKAQASGYIRTIVDGDRNMEDLLKTVKLEGSALNQYRAQILDVFKSEAVRTESKGGQPLVKPLSERELEVLGLIANGLSNQQVAESLFLSLNTVKGHTRNIYQKLGVNSRTKAVAEARTLHILV